MVISSGNSKSVTFEAARCACIVVPRSCEVLIWFGQIKYLRIPDTLLDAVKEEQTKAREAGRSARGAHVSGVGARGMLLRLSNGFGNSLRMVSQVEEVHSDVCPSPLSLCDSNILKQTLARPSRGGPTRGRGRGRGA